MSKPETSAKGMVIFYDDDAEFTRLFSSLMEDSGFEVKVYNDIKDLRRVLSDQSLYLNTRCLVFDLAKDPEEVKSGKYEIIEDIKDRFNKLRVPIFIHSAHANMVTDFDGCGTVWKVEKSGTSMETVTNSIMKLDESGFIEAFTPGGLIEKSLFEELHKSFTEQFRRGEIDKIIDSLKDRDDKVLKDRAVAIFKRLAIKSLMSSLLSPFETFSPIEHYYRRIKNDLEFWTGDIWEKKDKSLKCIIITPRCNVASKGTETLLVCSILPDFPDDNKKDRIKRALTDNPDISGTATRYLPPSPIFNGGRVDFTSVNVVLKQTLREDYLLECSLSDELTNEVLGKYGAYFLRTGITPFNLNEMISYVDLLKEENGK